MLSRYWIGSFNWHFHRSVDWYVPSIMWHWVQMSRTPCKLFLYLIDIFICIGQWIAYMSQKLKINYIWPDGKVGWRQKAKKHDQLKWRQCRIDLSKTTTTAAALKLFPPTNILLCHSSVDSSVPSILPPWVWVPSSPSMILTIYIDLCHVDKTKINKKRPGLAHFK